MRKNTNETALVLHNIRSAYNVGSIFRTADAAGIATPKSRQGGTKEGISKLYLVGTTPTPVDRFGRKRNDIHKTALGAEESVAWEYVPKIGILLERLKKDGFFLVAIEQSPHATHYKKIKSHKKTAYIFGNEVRGLSQAVLKQCDIAAEIPMKGKKESLNVSVVVGVILFR